MCGRPTDKNADFQGLALCRGFALVNANPPVDLVMKPDLFSREVIVAVQLDAVHAQVGSHHAGLVRVFGIYLWKGDEGTAVHGPVFNEWKVGDTNLPEVPR